MSNDAAFEDGAEKPLRLYAQDHEDLKLISALIQDAILPASEIRFDRRRREFSMLLNRFRWEHQPGQSATKKPERVQSLLQFQNVDHVASQGISPGDADQLLSTLSLDWQPTEAPSGQFELILAGEGGIRLRADAMDVLLADMTKPYLAPSGRTPHHDTEDED